MSSTPQRSRRFLVLGRNGQVGWELRHKLACLGEVVALDYPDIDFKNPDSLRSSLRSVTPAVIVNAAAYTAVDKAESEPDAAMAINGIAPGVLAEEAKRLGSILVHYSTDYVFDGSREGAYTETDSPNPQNVYGRTKLAGDEAVQAVGGDYLIFRTSWVYGSRGNNFLLTMLRLAQQRPQLRIVDDQVGAPTTSECIAEATAAALVQLRGGIEGRSGIYNLTNSGETSWFGFARALLEQAAKITGIAIPELAPISTSEYPTAARRPANSRLSCAKLQNTFGVALPHWEYALSLVLETIFRSGNSAIG